MFVTLFLVQMFRYSTGYANNIISNIILYDECLFTYYLQHLFIIIIHCSIFSHSHWLRAYDEFFIFCWWREHMTNNYRICHVLTPSETNTRFICHVLTPSELFAVICYVCLSVYNRFRQRRLLGLLIELWFCFSFGRTNRVNTGR